MARPSQSYQPIGADPDLASARLAAINQTLAPDDLPPQDHPMVSLARQLLSPLTYSSPEGSVGPMGPQGRPVSGNGSGLYGTPAASPGFNPYPAQPTPAQPMPDLIGGLRSAAYGIANAFGSGETDLGGAPLLGGIVSGLTHVTRPDNSNLEQIPGHIASQLGDLASATGTFLSGGREAAHLTPQPGESKESYQARSSALSEQSAERARGVLAAALPIPATPYTEIVGTVNVAQVQADPIMGQQYRDRIGDLPPDKQKDRYAQQTIAHQVLDATTARLLRALDDPNLSDDQKRAAFAVAGGLILQRVVELGGPQVVRQLASLGGPIASRVAAAAKGTAADFAQGAPRFVGEQAGEGRIDLGLTGPPKPETPVEGVPQTPAELSARIGAQPPAPPTGAGPAPLPVQPKSGEISFGPDIPGLESTTPEGRAALARARTAAANEQLSQGGVRDYAGNLNLDTLNAPADAKQLLRDQYEANPDALEEIRALAQTHGQSVAKAKAELDLARSLGMTPAEYTAKALSAADRTPGQLIASKMAVDQAARDAVLAHLDYAAHPDDPLLEGRALKALTDEFATQANVAGVVASSGRTLEANKILVRAANLSGGELVATPQTTALVAQAKNLLFGMRASEKYDELARQLIRIDPNDTGLMNKYVRETLQLAQDFKARTAPPPDLGWWFRHNLNGGLLSGLTAPAVAGSYVLKAARNVAEMYGATALQAIGLGRKVGTGGMLPRFDLPRTQTLVDANAYAYGALVRGTARGFSTFVNDFIHRQSTRALSEKAAGARPGEFDRYPTFTPAWPDSKFPAITPGDLAGFTAARTADVTGSFTRLVGSIEDAFRQSFTEGYLARELSVQARAKGLTGADRDAYINSRIDNPEYATYQRAAQAAAHNTYQFRAAGPKTQALIDVRDETLGGAGRLLFPFLNAPVNILRDVVQSTPAGFPIVGKAMNVATRGLYGEPFAAASGLEPATEGAVRIARAMIGTVGMATIYNQIVAGNIIGFNPYTRGTTEGDAWEAEHPELSVRIGDDPTTGRPRWVSVERIPPIAQLVKLMAAWQWAQDQQKGVVDANTVKLAAIRMARVFFDETWFTQLSSVMNAVENPDRYGKQLVVNLASENIPLSGRLRVINHEMGVGPPDPQSFEDYFKAAIPGLSQQVPTQQGLLGPREGNWNTGIMAEEPYRVAVDHATAIQQELLRLKAANFPIPEPIASKDAGRGVLFTDQELHGLRQIAYPQILDAVDKTMATPEYRQGSDAMKHVLLTKAVDNAHRQARFEFARDQMLLATDPKEIARAALVGMSTLNKEHNRADWIDYLNHAGKLTPEVTRAIDDSRSKTQEIQPPSVQEYLRAAPLVHQYLEIPPFRIGNQQEWNALGEAQKRQSLARDALARAGAPGGPHLDDLAIASLSPQDQQLIRRYDPTGVRDPRRAQMIRQYPWLERFISGEAKVQATP